MGQGTGTLALLEQFSLPCKGRQWHVPSSSQGTGAQGHGDGSHGGIGSCWGPVV